MHDHEESARYPSKGPNFFPAQLCRGFEKDLDNLIESLNFLDWTKSGRDLSLRSAGIPISGISVKSRGPLTERHDSVGSPDSYSADFPPVQQAATDNVSTTVPLGIAEDSGSSSSGYKPDVDFLKFKASYLKSEYKSKYIGSDTIPAVERKAAAIQKWMGVEETNLKTNMRLQIGDTDFGWCTSQKLLATARKHVQRVLGPLEYPGILTGSSHTNGASTRIRRSANAAILKHAGKAHVTSDALKHWFAFASGTRLSKQELEVVESSVMFTVPKATEIDRVACKEPEINMFLQKQVGNAIRRLLRTEAKINLNDQGTNQRLAKVAVTRGLATLDLSSASDSISKQLVMELLPFEWWSLLEDLRVKSISIDGEIHEPEMFSSMGNGFTFELESLLFYALTSAIMRLSGVKGRVSVYGDDIIAPAKIAPRIARIFSWLGFKVNSKKSHWSGPFRESCGKHYHNGRDITPFYLKEPIRSKTDVIRILNRLVQWDGTTEGWLTTPEVVQFHRHWSGHIPLELHGGQDLESITSLVTGDPPRRRLLTKSRDLPYSHSHAVDYWLTVKAQPRKRFDPYSRLEVKPQKVSGMRISDQPLWLEHTVDSPYYLYS